MSTLSSAHSSWRYKLRRTINNAAGERSEPAASKASAVSFNSSLDGTLEKLGGSAGHRGCQSVLTLNLRKARERRELPTAPNRDANTTAFGIPGRIINDPQNWGGQFGRARCDNRFLPESERREELMSLWGQVNDHAILVYNAQTPSTAELPNFSHWIDSFTDQSKKLDPRLIRPTQDRTQLIIRWQPRLLVKSTEGHELTRRSA